MREPAMKKPAFRLSAADDLGLSLGGSEIRLEPHNGDILIKRTPDPRRTT
jgi:hypothetical protein